MCNRIMKFARNGGTLFHHDQLLLTLLMPVERKRGGQLLHQGINQLLLIVAEMASLRQSSEQDTILGMRIGQSPFQRDTAVNGGQRAARTQMAAFLITAGIGLAGKFLMIVFIFQVINPKFNIMQQGQILQAVQYRREAFAQRYLRVQAAVGLPQEREDLVFVLQARCFLLYPLFQHRVTFGQFLRHII